MNLADRLQRALAERPDVSKADLARACGIKQPSVSDWFNGKTKRLSGSNLLEAARRLRVRPEWLATGMGPMHDDAIEKDAGIPHVEPSEDDFELVPQLDISASCGDGKFAEHVVVRGGLAFKKSFMRQFGISETNSRIIYAQGQSMEPTIGDGRVVLINLTDTVPQDGKVFLICDQDGALILKRLVREYDPTVQATIWKTRSDNPDKRQYPDKILPDDPRVKIVGRAIWHDGLL